MEVKVLPNKLKETLNSGGKVYGTMLWGIQGTRLLQTLSSDYIDYVVIEAEHAARGEEDARLRELYPLPEDEEEFSQDETEEVETKVEDLIPNETDNNLESNDNDMNEALEEEDGAR